MTARDPLARVAAKPRPEDWRDDDAMTLAEAVAVFYPQGPLTVSSLRTEIRKGRLLAAEVAGRLYVTPARLKGLFEPRTDPWLVDQKAPGSISGKVAPTGGPTTSGSSVTDRKKSAQAALQAALRTLNKPSPNTSLRNGRRTPSGLTAAPVTRPTFS